MIRDSKEKTAWAYRTLREAPDPAEANVEITLFTNFFGTVKKSQKFDDPQLYTVDRWFVRLLKEIKAMRLFKRNQKHD